MRSQISSEFYHVNLTLSRSDTSHSGWDSNIQVDYNVSIPVDFFDVAKLSKVIGEQAKKADELWNAKVLELKAAEAEELRQQAENDPN